MSMSCLVKFQRPKLQLPMPFHTGPRLLSPPFKFVCWRNFFRKRARILFREHCFGEENSLSFGANSVSSAKNLVSLRLHTNNRLKGTH